MRFAVVFVAVAITSTLAFGATSSRVSFTERYSILSDRNIFLKDRSHPTTRSSSSTQPSRFSDPEQSVVLRGVVFEDNAYRAYVENMSTAELKRVSVGDPIGKGKAGAIDLDGMWYEGPTGRTRVEIGSDLTGQAAAPPPVDEVTSASPTTSPSTMPANLAGLNPNDPTLTTEQKMKLKRLMELKGKQ